MSSRERMGGRCWTRSIEGGVKTVVFHQAGLITIGQVATLRATSGCGGLSRVP